MWCYIQHFQMTFCPAPLKHALTVLRKEKYFIPVQIYISNKRKSQNNMYKYLAPI